eukprot:CAMPEP_0203682988 /NCGR_PEP_ID=MMETSP0090-20130426/47288_1 /ASSEMBLY_ACC=CAM_ASM_001088 /TAXON_ID=426623 /ORGANISM="Chaetoceros affinis, Strain CCMP159" /LENGTH=1506 /DNA_ID=CAMNT_0050552109 /DNA_START=94 /DNA_END=4614 /DNA_ORIENTATION=+
MMRSLSILLYVSILSVADAAFNQAQEIDYLNNFNAIDGASYAAVDDPEEAGASLLSECKRGNSNSAVAPSVTVEVVPPTNSNGNIVTTEDVQSQCDSTSNCIIPEGVLFTVTSSLNVGSLTIRGDLEWTDDTTTSTTTQQQIDSYVCAGYIAVENNGSWFMKVEQSTAWIFLKDNGGVHTHLRSRAFGAVAMDENNDYPIIDIQGRELKRTWSLLSHPVSLGDDSIKLLHHPTLMNWKVGDRIGIAPTKERSQGWGDEFRIESIAADGTITLDRSVQDDFDATFIPALTDDAGGRGRPALMSAEVVNLNRSIIITGDSFNHVPCDNSLPESILGEQTSTLGCRCASFRSQCTMGLHVIHMHGGVSRIQNTRIEKCGQRGVEGKYCLHFHKMKDCPDCLYKNNAIENGHQRGIIVHGTHRSTVEENVLYNVRGAGIYIEDGNEMSNYINYNAIICPFPFNNNQLHGCTVPGTSNVIADTSDNQSGIFSRASNNSLIGNRVANSFNGMLLQALGSGRGADNVGKVCEADNAIGRWAGNVFHGHGRFGTYSLGRNYPKVTDQAISADGQNSNLELCTGFDSEGNTRGLPVAIHDHLDYGNAFVGHYEAGDIQYSHHHSIENLNLMYWKETKGFEDGCSSHITNSYYADGNLALPDQSTFIIQDTLFENSVSLEANHHCNVGNTGVLCMPQYILHAVKWKANRDRKWVWFQNFNTQGHTANQNFGGIFTLSPPDAQEVIDTGSLDGSIFPPGFVSVVSSKFTYLLTVPGQKCVPSNTLGSDIGYIYDNGILCKVPLRSLKIYSRGLTSGSAPNILINAWFGGEKEGVPHASQQIAFHQVGGDNQTKKQGYSFPVIPGVENTYQISLLGGNQNIPLDWVVEFSDWVVGNRWSIEFITLILQGRPCPNNNVVSSHHDRKFLWSGDEFMDDQAWGNHGACTSSPDMPIHDCSSKNGVIVATDCPESCPDTCNNHSYCDCGSQECRCKEGFGGLDCSIDLCDAARCGDHGSCSATYLGSSLPVTGSNACVCEDGWYGHLCQYNPCSTLNKTCSGHGTCIANGALSAVCECDTGYSGENCETSCDGFCQGSYPFSCSSNLPDVVLYGCNRFGGCSYKKEGEGSLGSDFCVYKEVGTGDSCTCETDECKVVGPCNDIGECPEAVQQPDGTPCHSIPWGICKNGQCTEPSTSAPVTSTSSPVASTTAPVVSTPAPVASTTAPVASTLAPVPSPTTSCDGFCQGSYPFNCNPSLQDVVLYGCNQFGGCSYKKEGEGPLGSDFCVFKKVGTSAPVTSTSAPVVSTLAPVPSPTTNCDGFCQGSYPFNCNPSLQDVVLYGCNQFGGCSYKKEGEGPLGSDFCVFKKVGTSAPVTSTSAPVVSTPAPVVSTPAPVASTTAPVTSTLAPVPSPTTSCEIKGQIENVENRVSNMESIVQNLESRTESIESTLAAILSILQTSTQATTSPVVSCADRRDQWEIKGKLRNWCSWAKKAGNEYVASRCASKNLDDDCPVTCGICTP